MTACHQQLPDPATADQGRAEPAAALLTRYHGLICDLDGVVYRGPEPVPGAVETLDAVVRTGVPVVFATNNASRPPAAVGEHLRRLGLGERGWSVVTSSQAAADHLSGLLPRDEAVLAVGGPGVTEALEEVGFAPLRVPDLAPGAHVAAVVQGAGPDVSWRDLAEIAFAVQSGATWVATNTDPTIPTSRGAAPGNGTLVAAVRTATAAEPHVCGKPGPALFDLARRRLGTPADRTLVVGDRLDTDVRGARGAGLDSLLVLSGACRLRDLVWCPVEERPTYVALDLRGLLDPVDRQAGDDELVRVTPRGDLEICRQGPPARLLEALVTTAWRVLDGGGSLSEAAQPWAALEARLTAPGARATSP